MDVAVTSVRRWFLLVTVAAGLLLITVDNSILYTALPTLTRELTASSSEGLWIINAYPLVMAGLLLGTGTLGDRIGHRRMFLIGLVIFGLSSLLAAFAPTALVLIVARALLGVGAATMMPATLALIRVTFDDVRERNMAIAIWGSLAIVGSAIGPIAGGVLLEHFWWGSVFLVNVPVVLVALVATYFVAPANDADPTKQWDLLSSLQIMVGLVGLVVAIKEVAKPSPSWLVLTLAVLAGVLGVWVFTRRQGRLSYPLLDFGIFRNSAFMAGVVAAGVAMFAIAGIELATTQRYQLVSSFSPLQAGLLVATVAAGSLVTALVGGAILHRVGLRPLIFGGLSVSVLGIPLILVGLNNGIGWMILGLFVVGAGLGAAMSVASSAIMGNVTARRAGMASSVEEVSYEFGSLTAVALLGSALAAIYTSTIDLPAGAPEAAKENITVALELAGAKNPALVDAAATAFDSGYLVVTIVVGIVLVIGAVTTGILLRGRAGDAQTVTA